MRKFKNFLIKESAKDLNTRIGYLTNSLDELKSEYDQLGNRQVIKNLTSVADEIRRIINEDWPSDCEQSVKTLQKLAFFILKSIDSNEDLKNTLDITLKELYNLSSQKQIKVNDL